MTLTGSAAKRIRRGLADEQADGRQRQAHEHDGVHHGQGETINDVATRAHRVLERARAVDGDVLLFGHGHQLRVLTALWLEYPAVAAQRLQLATASPSMLGYENTWTALLSWNGLPAS